MMSTHASNASMHVSVQVCMYASMSISGTSIYSIYQIYHYLLSLWLMTHRITTLLHPEASTSHIFLAGTQMAIRGLGTKAKITTKITAPQMAKFFTNSSSMIPTSADVFFSRGFTPGWEDFPGRFPKRNHSGTGDYGVRGFFGLV